LSIFFNQDNGRFGLLGIKFLIAEFKKIRSREMKKLTNIILAICLIGVIGISIFAQNSNSNRDSKSSDEIRQENIQKQKEEEWLKKNKTVGLPDDPAIPNVKATTPTRPTAIQPTKKQAIRLRPAAEDLAKYAVFLKQSNTGLFKLFPELDCGGKFVVHAEGPCAEEIPLSSFYSFRKKNYAERGLSDIGFKDSFLFNDGWLSNGIMVRLGDLPLDSVSVSSDGVKFLTDYVPAVERDEVTAKSVEMIKGIKIGDYHYSKVATATENTTYAIRIIAYRGKVLKPVGRNLFANELEGDKRTDIIVAFRVIRKNEDGSLTLLWKELQRKDSPTIKTVPLDK
jgi:hypothetical protein